MRFKIIVSHNEGFELVFNKYFQRN